MWLGDILLAGILTVIVGRAVFGSTITLAEAWAKVRGRLLALIGFAALEAAGVILLGFIGGLIFAVIKVVGNGAAFVFGLPLVLAVAAIIGYFYTLLSFAPVLIVLERLPVINSITRSITLVRNDFWRVFGIRLLAAVVAIVVGYAVAAPLTLAGQLMVATHLQWPGVVRHHAHHCRLGDRSDHHHTVQRRSGRLAVHRPPDTRRGVRPGAANRRYGRTAGDGVHRLSLADPAGLRTG